jgi:hypothetical protein
MREKFFRSIRDEMLKPSTEDAREQKELGEGYPKITLHFDLVRHKFGNDISQGMRERIRDADILFIERTDWSPPSMARINEVSFGIREPAALLLVKVQRARSFTNMRML